MYTSYSAILKRIWMPFGTKLTFAPEKFLKQFLRKLKKKLELASKNVLKSDLNFKA